MQCKGGQMACYWKAVPEPRLQNEIIFRLPQLLKDYDEIEISGKMIPNPETIFLNLKSATRYFGNQKIDCQIEVNFSLKKIIFSIKENGKNNEYEAVMSPSELFTDSTFKITIVVGMDGNSQKLFIYIGESYVDCWDEVHNLKNIEFLTLSNDIEKVEELKFKYP